MKLGIKKLLDDVNNNINKLSNKILDDSYQLDELDINIDVKHILEDMRSILDYIAVDIYNKYCGSHTNKKIYFPYSNENEDEQKYISNVNKNFPNLYSNYYSLYKELSNVQSFSDSSYWLIKLVELTNEVKHNELCITKVQKERNIIMASDDTFIQVKGNLNIHKIGKNRYGVSGEGAVSVSGDGRLCFSCDGTVVVGNGTYNVDTKESNNLNTEIYYENSVKSKKYNENIIDLLNLIFNKETQLISNLDKYI